MKNQLSPIPQQPSTTFLPLVRASPPSNPHQSGREKSPSERPSKRTLDPRLLDVAFVSPLVVSRSSHLGLVRPETTPEFFFFQFVELPPNWLPNLPSKQSPTHMGVRRHLACSHILLVERLLTVLCFLAQLQANPCPRVPREYMIAFSWCSKTKRKRETPDGSAFFCSARPSLTSSSSPCFFLRGVCPPSSHIPDGFSSIGIWWRPAPGGGLFSRLQSFFPLQNNPPRSGADCLLLPSWRSISYTGSMGPWGCRRRWN